MIDDEEGERTVRLDAGNAYLVPRATWHRQIILEPAEVRFVTAGADTKMRPVEG